MVYDPHHHFGPRSFMTRREMLQQTSTGFGMLALSALLADHSGAGPRQSVADGPLAAKLPHFPPKVKNVIFCYMSGGLSHIDSFDPKPRLAAEAGNPMPFQTERTATSFLALGRSLATGRAGYL